MDGYKKIRFVVLLMILLIIGYACQTTKRPAGSYLFIDDSDSINMPDSIIIDTSALENENINFDESPVDTSSGGFQNKKIPIDTSKNEQTESSGQIQDRDKNERSETPAKQKDVEPKTRSDIQKDTVIVRSETREVYKNNNKELKALQNQYENRIRDLQETITFLKEIINDNKDITGNKDTVFVSQKILVADPEAKSTLIDSVYTDRDALQDIWHDSLQILNAKIEQLQDENEKLFAIAYDNQSVYSESESINNGKDSLLTVYKKSVEQKRDSIRSLKESQVKQDSLTPRADTIIIRDTIKVKNSVIVEENNKLNNENERLKDSLKALQNKSEKLSSAQSQSDKIVLAAYYNSSALEAQNWSEIKSKLDQISFDKIRMILISGYTDSSGPENINLQLSEKRAKSIEQKLLNTGISPGKIFSQYFGEQFASEQSIDEERRVEITILMN